MLGCGAYFLIQFQTASTTITALIERGGFKIRAIVRPASKANSDEYVRKGVEVRIVVWCNVMYICFLIPRCFLFLLFVGVV